MSPVGRAAHSPHPTTPAISIGKLSRRNLRSRSLKQPGPLPQHVLYATSARIGGSGLDAVALETLRGIEPRLERALAFANRGGGVARGKIRTLEWHPVRLLSFLGSEYYYAAKKRALDSAAAAALSR